MNKKLDVHNFWRSHIFIVLIFAIMSVMSGIFMYRSHFVGIPYDIGFHWQRIYEIRSAIMHGYFPNLIAENYFSQSGSAVMGMYPQYNLLPMVILSFLIKSSIDLFNLTFVIITFCALLISYFSSYAYKKNKKISFIFSIAYVLNTSLLCYYCGVAFSIGTITAISCLPFVLFGFLSLLDKNKWIELSIGVSLIFLSHIISFGITIIFLAILFIINIYDFKNCKKILSLGKAIITTLLLTSIFWIPFSIISTENNLNIPKINYIAGDSFSTIFSILDNGITTSITLVGIIGLLLCIISYKKLSYRLKQLFWVAIIFLIMSSSLFPWHLLGSTFLIHLQFPYRLNIIPQLLLCYLFSEVFNLMIKNNKNSCMIVLLISMAILCLQMDAQKGMINNFAGKPESVESYAGGVNTVLKSDSEFKNILYTKDIVSDYYPKVALTSVNNVRDSFAVYGNGKQIHAFPLKNGKFSFKTPQRINKLSLPFLYYHGIDYQVKLDGKTVKGYSNKNALMTINNVRKGKHHVQIIVHKTKAEITSYALSLIGLLILLGAIIKNFLKKHKVE